MTSSYDFPNKDNPLYISPRCNKWYEMTVYGVTSEKERQKVYQILEKEHSKRKWHAVTVRFLEKEVWIRSKDGSSGYRGEETLLDIYEIEDRNPTTDSTVPSEGAPSDVQ